MHYWSLAVVVLLMVSVLARLIVLVIQESRTPRLVCLMYHRLASREVYERRRGTETIFALPADHFEQQTAYLKEAGYTFATAEQVRLFASGELELSGPTVLVTFDDGCASVDEIARPILERYGACGTVFVTTDPESYVFKLGDGTDRRLTDEELSRIDGDALCVESHAVTHRPLRGMSEDELRSELTHSKRELERVLSRKIEYFAVPGNWYDRRVMKIAREVGYKAVWYSNPGAVRVGAGLFGLPRVNVEGELSLEQFIRALHPVGIAKRRLLAGIKRIPARLLGPRYWLPLRKVIMGCIPGHHLSMRRMLTIAKIVAVAGTIAVIWLLISGGKG